MHNELEGAILLFSLMIALLFQSISDSFTPKDPGFCKSTNFTDYMCESKQDVELVNNEIKLVKEELIYKINLINEHMDYTSFGSKFEYFVIVEGFDGYYGDFSILETEAGSVFVVKKIDSFENQDLDADLYKMSLFKEIKELIELLIYYKTPSSGILDKRQFGHELLEEFGVYPIAFNSWEYYELSHIYETQLTESKLISELKNNQQ